MLFNFLRFFSFSLSHIKNASHLSTTPTFCLSTTSTQSLVRCTIFCQTGPTRGADCLAPLKLCTKYLIQGPIAKFGYRSENQQSCDSQLALFSLGCTTPSLNASGKCLSKDVATLYLVLALNQRSCDFYSAL